MTAIGEYDVLLELAPEEPAGIAARFIGTSVRGRVCLWDPAERLLVLYERGRSVFSGQGQPWTYSPAEYQLYRLADPDVGIATTARCLGRWSGRAATA